MVHIEAVRKQLHARGKLPNPETWQAVFLPALNGEQACFIRPSPQGTELSLPHKPRALQGRFEVVPFHEDRGLVDCAHFASKCLKAGGVKIPNESWVPSLVQLVRNLPDTRTLGLKVTKDQGDAILATGIMKPGDFIAYWKPIQRIGRADYGHSAIYVGVDADPDTDPQEQLKRNGGQGTHRISCHTGSRYGASFHGEAWFLTEGADRRYTLVHFSDPEDKIPPFVASVMGGWFEVAQAGRKEYYHLLPDGKCEKSQRAPGPRPVRVTKPEDTGYWFFRNGKAILFWPYRGQVDRFTFPGPVLGGIVDSIAGVVNQFAAVVKRLVPGR
jgi:hypothetical protein